MKPFDHKDRTLQCVCALLFWVHRVVSAATDVAMGCSLNPDPVGELVTALERVRDGAESWLREIDPSRPMWPTDQGMANSAKSDEAGSSSPTESQR